MIIKKVKMIVLLFVALILQNFYSPVYADNWVSISPINQINVGAAVGGIALSPDESKLYAALWEDQNSSRVLEYSLPNLSLLQTITFGSYHTHGDVVVSSDGTRIFTPNYYYNDLSQIELDNGNARTDLPTVDTWPADVDITPDKTKVLVAAGKDGRSYDMNNDSIAVYDIDNGNFSLLASVKLDDEPMGRKMAYSEDSRFAYVVSRKRKSANPKLYEISLEPPYQVTRTMEFPNISQFLAGVACIGDNVYVSGLDDSTISVVDRLTWTGDQVFVSNSNNSYSIDGPASLLAVHPGKQYLFVGLPLNGSVLALDINSMTVVGRYDDLPLTGFAGLMDIEFNNNGTRMYISYMGNGEIFIFQISSSSVIEATIDIKPGSYPNSINLGSLGLIPVAILSSVEFDATTVDADTVELGGAEVAVRGKGSKLMAHEEDVNEDGLIDLVIHIATANLDPDSFQDGWAVLTGSTYDGQEIIGEDEISIVPVE